MNTWQRNFQLVVACAILVGFNTQVSSGEFVFDTGVSSEFVEQKIKVKNDNSTIETSNTLLTPFVSGNYVGRDLSFTLRGNHNHVNKSLSNESVTTNYTDYGYSGRYTIVKNLLAVAVSGSQGYRSASANSLVLDDFLLNADSLFKVKSNNASGNLNLPTGKYIGLSANLSFTKSESDREVEVPGAILNSFNNESYGGNFAIKSGESFHGIRAQLTSSTYYSKRSENQDFVSQIAGLAVNINMYKNLGLAVNLNYEKNEIKSNESSLNGLRDFKSAGIGLIWESSKNRSIEVTWNRSETAPLTFAGDLTQEPEIDNFIGMDVNWQFSPRSQFNASVSRRFFGDSGNLSFTHSLRNWRTKISYAESVNTTSRLVSSNTPGLLICDNANSNIDDCFLSETLEPDLTPGQVLLPIIEQGFELNDRIILRKQLSLSSAISRRRTTITLSGSMSQNDELEIDREFDTHLLSLSIGFRISPKTSLRLIQSYSKTEGTSEGEFKENEVIQANIQLERSLSRRFKASLGIKHLDLKGESLLGGALLRGVDGPFTDNRITIGFRYDYGSRR